MALRWEGHGFSRAARGKNSRDSRAGIVATEHRGIRCFFAKKTGRFPYSFSLIEIPGSQLENKNQ
jgi:hypothetical protein